MTELYLQSQGNVWTRVFTSDTQSFKLTRENSYFTQSESYTLDVSLPMDILSNRQLFANIQRFDVSKHAVKMPCRLNVDNVPVLYGTAQVIQVTQEAVKVQLLGGNSEIKFLSSENEDYIDEIDFGKVVAKITGHGPNGRAIYSYETTSGLRIEVTPVFNETADTWGNTAQLCLVDVAVKVIEYYGFSVTENCLNVEPWNRIFIAAPFPTKEVKRTLPHWTSYNFIKEFCNFFNVRITTDQMHKTAKIVSNMGLPGRSITYIEPVDEYTAELSQDEAHSMANDTLSFSLSDSSEHDYDCIKEDVRDGLSKNEYNSWALAYTAWSNMAENLRKRYVFSCPEGKFASWMHDYSDTGNSELVEEFTKIDMFAPLKRNAKAASTELKIVPVAMGYFHTNSNNIEEWLRMPAVQSDIKGENLIFGAAYGGSLPENTPEHTVQEYIEGEEINQQKDEDSRLEVMFIDANSHTYLHMYNSSRPSGEQWSDSEGKVGFTDGDYKKPHWGANHMSWSLSLNPSGNNYYLGQLHSNNYTFNMHAKHTFKFISVNMPDPSDVFIIRGKKYGCEKVEADVKPDGFDRLMTGYFYEML